MACGSFEREFLPHCIHAFYPTVKRIECAAAHHGPGAGRTPEFSLIFRNLALRGGGWRAPGAPQNARQ